jgi:hypothetical protein
LSSSGDQQPFGFRAPQILTEALLAALRTEPLGPTKKGRSITAALL